MKTLFKVFAVVVALIIVVILAGSVALHIYLPPEKAKKLVLEHLSTQLKREVALGSVSVGLLSGLQMADLKISESPNFSKGVFLSSEQFSVKIALMPLLFRKVVVRQIILNKPEVAIIRNADGKTFNFSDLTSSAQPITPAPVAAHGGKPAAGTPHPAVAAAAPTKPKEEEKSEALPFLLVVSRADISGGALHFIDRSPARQSMDIAPFDLTLKNVSLTTPFSVQTSMQIKSKGSTLALNFTGDANLLEGSFKIKQGSLVSKESKVTVLGTLNGLKSSTPDVDLNITIPQLDLANFKGFVNFPPELHVEGAFTGQADVSGNEKSMGFSAALDGTNTKIQYAVSFVKPVKTPCSISVGGTLKNLSEVDIQSLKAILGALVLSGHGKIQNLSAPLPVIGFHVDSNAFPIEDLLVYAPGSVPAGVTLKGTNKLSADLSGTSTHSQFSAKWDGSELNITQGDDFAKAAGLPMELSIIGETAGPDKIIIKNLNAKLLSNQVVGSGTYETKGTQAIINFAAKGTNWSVQDLAKVSPLAAPYHPTGTLSFDMHASGPTTAPQATIQTTADIAMADVKQQFYEGKNLQLKWNLSQITQDLSKVNGSASLKQGPGQILNVDQLASSSRIGKIMFAPIATLAQLQQKGLLGQMNLPSLLTISFDSIVGDYLFHSGIMDIKTFDLSGQALSIQNQGTVGLAGARPINLNVVMKLAAGTGGQLGDLIKDENGRPTIKFTATGPAANPKVNLDVQDVGKRALQQAGQQILKNPNVQDAVNNALKGLFH